MIAKSSQITYYGYFHYLAFYSYIWFVFYNSDNKSWVLWDNHMTYKLLPFWNPERKILLQQSHHWQIKPALIDQIKLFINRTFKNYSLVQLKNQSSGILQARILGWVAMPSSRGSSQPRDRSQVSHLAGRFFTFWATRKAQWCWPDTENVGMNSWILIYTSIDWLK